MNEKIKDFVKQNIGYFIVAFVCIIYILTSYLTIDKTGKSIERIIADGSIALFLGLFINTMLGLQGMMLGDRDERVRVTAEEHCGIVLRISPYIDRLDEWCRLENAKNYILQRTKILARAGLKYDDCFDKDGVAKSWEPDKERLKGLTRKSERKKVKAYKEAVNLKLTALSAGDLTGEGGRDEDPYYFGRTKTQYETQTGIKELVSKLGTAVIFGYYGVKLVEEFSYANLIWMGLQVATFLITGVIKLYKDYNYVINEFRGRIVKKTDNLQKFENYIKSQEKKENVE